MAREFDLPAVDVQAAFYTALDGQAHIAHLTGPETFAAQVVAFLRDQ